MSDSTQPQPERLHLITGRLAEPSLRRVAAKLEEELGVEISVEVLPITVAALMTPEWIAKRIRVPPQVDRVLVPGYCEGDLSPIEIAAGKPVQRGPRTLLDLPAFLGAKPSLNGFGPFDIEIVAEINHCPRLSIPEIVKRAQSLSEAGADVVDIGCEPGHAWRGVGEAVRALRGEGCRVSVDSLNPIEIAAAVAAGAELVLSVNSTNCEAAADWGCEVVAIPDDPKTLLGLDETIDCLAKAGVPLRVDPILEPIGFGFAESLGRYSEVRRRYPDAEMLMGIGNLTELTEVDSAGVNTVLLAYCQELGIRSVLTTQVIHWAQSSVKECDLARRLAHYAVSQSVLPKHVDAGLVMLRAGESLPIAPETLNELAAAIKDPNYRVFATGKAVHLVGKGVHLSSPDPFVIFDALQQDIDSGRVARSLDPGHAFYLGYEMAKASTANTLGKAYEQDEPLEWGMLTQSESVHRLRHNAIGATKKEAD